jgi:hypothetical protein
MINLNRIASLAASVVISLACNGCAMRGSASKYYELVRIDQQYFLLAPSASESQAQTKKIQLQFTGAEEAPQKCSIHGAWFSLYPDVSGKASAWIAEVPTAEAWEKSLGFVDMQPEWQKFLDELYRRHQQGCFGGISTYFSIKEEITEHMSIPANQALLFRYAYGPGGYIDLAPKMKLRIERNIFQHGDSGYQGTRITYYDAVRGKDNDGVELKLERGGINSADPSVTSFDTTLAAQFAKTPYLRLFLLNLMVQQQVKAPAILIGGSNLSDINDATRLIVNNPDASCGTLHHASIVCAAFDGMVTVSSLLPVRVNGKWNSYPAGTQIHSVASYDPVALKTLRVQRLYQGRYIDLKFKSDPEDVTQITLLSGDIVSWKKKGESAH